MAAARKKRLASILGQPDEPAVVANNDAEQAQQTRVFTVPEGSKVVIHGVAVWTHASVAECEIPEDTLPYESLGSWLNRASGSKRSRERQEVPAEARKYLIGAAEEKGENDNHEQNEPGHGKKIPPEQMMSVPCVVISFEGEELLIVEPTPALLATADAVRGYMSSVSACIEHIGRMGRVKTEIAFEITDMHLHSDIIFERARVVGESNVFDFMQDCTFAAVDADAWNRLWNTYWSRQLGYYFGDEHTGLESFYNLYCLDAVGAGTEKICVSGQIAGIEIVSKSDTESQSDTEYLLKIKCGRAKRFSSAGGVRKLLYPDAAGHCASTVHVNIKQNAPLINLLLGFEKFGGEVDMRSCLMTWWGLERVRTGKKLFINQLTSHVGGSSLCVFGPHPLYHLRESASALSLQPGEHFAKYIESIQGKQMGALRNRVTLKMLPNEEEVESWKAAVKNFPLWECRLVPLTSLHIVTRFMIGPYTTPLYQDDTCAYCLGTKDFHYVGCAVILNPEVRSDIYGSGCFTSVICAVESPAWPNIQVNASTNQNNLIRTMYKTVFEELADKDGDGEGEDNKDADEDGEDEDPDMAFLRGQFQNIYNEMDAYAQARTTLAEPRGYFQQCCHFLNLMYDQMFLDVAKKGGQLYGRVHKVPGGRQDLGRMYLTNVLLVSNGGPLVEFQSFHQFCDMGLSLRIPLLKNIWINAAARLEPK